MSSITDYLIAFAVGGAICVVGELLCSLQWGYISRWSRSQAQVQRFR